MLATEFDNSSMYQYILTHLTHLIPHSAGWCKEWQQSSPILTSLLQPSRLCSNIVQYFSSSLSTFLQHAVFGLPPFNFPSGVQCTAVLVTKVLSLHNIYYMNPPSGLFSFHSCTFTELYIHVLLIYLSDASVFGCVIFFMWFSN